MKHKADKSINKRHPANVKTAKPVCGTLSYLAECRGVTQKAGSIRSAPPESIDKIVRK
ncbi:MAG: hypothetical protein M0R70_08090 [Nitrospirae bacterium]|nr:hypothetical protein [Nitrospirota bacterium]